MKKIILLIIFFSVHVSANELPELGSSFDSFLSQADEKKVKFQILKQVYQSNSYVNDPEITDYFNNLGNSLIKNGLNENLSINFFLVNDSSINALAMLGNIIGIHTGLVFASRSESELASVISHEIAHVSQKHLLRLFDSQARNTYKTYLAVAIAILVARSSPQLASGAMVAGAASQVQNVLDYTRANEREADRIGLQILNKSGYDPRGFIDFFNSMQKFNEFSSGAAPAFLRTHPITVERISDIQDRIKDYEYVQKKNPIEFYFIKAKIKGLIGDSNLLSEKFLDEIQAKNYVNEAAAYYGLIYSLIRQNKIHEALRHFEYLKSLNIQSPMLIHLNAQLLILENKYEEAFEIYSFGLTKNPYYRAFVLGYAQLLIQRNSIDEAIDFIRQYLNIFDNDSNLYFLLSKAFQLKKEPQLEHESLSYAFYYQYNMDDAIIQMDMAVKVNSDNFHNQSRVEYRLKELMREQELMNL